MNISYRIETHIDFLKLLVLVSILLCAFKIILHELDSEGFWFDESWTAWTIYLENSTIRNIPERLLTTINRVSQHDVHPPLYYMLMSIWSSFLGESEFMLRLPSAVFGLIALSSIYALSRCLFDNQVALLAMTILGTSTFFLYYTRGARMYSPYLTLVILSMLVYWCWLRYPTRKLTITHGILMGCMLLTHYTSVMIIVVQLALLPFLPCRQTTRRHRFLLPYCLAFLLFGLWLPFAIGQYNFYTNSPLTTSIASDWAIASLWEVLTSNSSPIFVLIFLFSYAVIKIRTDYRQISFLLVWLLLPPIQLLILNEHVAPMFQIRYLIPILPTISLLFAYGLRHACIPFNRRKYMSMLVKLLLLAGVIYTQVAYTNSPLLPTKPPWRDTFEKMIDMHDPTHPTLIGISEISVEAYYARQFKLYDRQTFEVIWSDNIQEELDKTIDTALKSTSVWAILPHNNPQSWEIMARLNQSYHAGYRDSVMRMLFYRFDEPVHAKQNLEFRFDDIFAYQNEIARPINRLPGDTLCFPIDLQALQNIDGRHSLGVSVTNKRNIVFAQRDTNLGHRGNGEQFMIESCIDLPTDIPEDIYYVQLAIYEWETLLRLNVFELSDTVPIYWGNFIVSGVVSVGME